MMTINKNRLQKINSASFSTGKVLYWMSREQRVYDNWSLLAAQQIAGSHDIEVVFNLVPTFLAATIRHYDFMLKGLQDVEDQLTQLNIPFRIVVGNPADNIATLINDESFTSLIMDFDPLKIKQAWKEDLLSNVNIPIFEVDSSNVVPCRIASPKKEYAAYTIRKKIHRQLPEFLTEIPKPTQQSSQSLRSIDWMKLYKKLSVSHSVPPIRWLTPGEKAAEKHLQHFINNKIHYYAKDRNDPNKKATANLSPYLHFGQISAQRIALEIINSDTKTENKDAFLEELIVRKELADNFCYYCNDYDNPKGFSNWAQKTLAKHDYDQREHLYSLENFELAKTHDELWNAAQNELRYRGKIHGFMRMYWGKKILEWSPNVESAMKRAIFLNDKYAIDGRDPRGYTGIAWAIGGVHDRAWRDRKIFGKIRYMNYNGCKRKFDIKQYINQWTGETYVNNN